MPPLPLSASVQGLLRRNAVALIRLLDGFPILLLLFPLAPIEPPLCESGWCGTTDISKALLLPEPFDVTGALLALLATLMFATRRLDAGGTFAQAPMEEEAR